MAEESGISIVHTIIEPLMKRVIRHVLYAFNFNKIIGKLKQETVELKMAQDRVQRDVEKAKCNAEEIENDVVTWQMDVEKITAEVERLEEDIREKKSCFNGLCPNFCARYRFGKQAMKKKHVITKLCKMRNFSRVSYFPNDNLPGIEFYENKDFIPSTSARSAFNMIIKELKDDKKKIIALYGMGGVGKTTLAVEVGKKAKELKLVDEVIMAVVSQNPSMEGIQGQIADMIGLRFEESSSVGKANRLRLRLEKMEKKVLIVLDDLWAKLDLASIGIPSSDNCTNCKVLLTTRRQQVCNSMGSQCNIPLDVLTDEEAWALFSKCGGLSNEPSPFIVVAKLIANECKGLPLAIVAVATALKDKTPNEWKVALHRLRGSRYVGNFEADQDVYKCIRFSYDYLQDKEAKLCFLLCSLFPEDHSIEVEVLVRYAYGLGLCQDAADSIESVRAELCVVITTLKASSLLLSGSDMLGRESNGFIKMHDIVRDVALWISSEDGNNESMTKAGMGLEEWPRSMHYQSFTRISLMKNAIVEHPSGLVCSRLNLLLLDKNGCYKFPNDFFNGMKALQVLSVSDHWSSLSFSLPQSIQHLTNLRILRIEWLQLDDISLLGNLKDLEILSLRGSYFEELSETIGEIKGLRMLDLSNCKGMMRIPANLLKKLSKLEELYIGKLGRDEGSYNVILCDLMSLSKLSLLSLEIDNIQCLREAICFPKHLVRYYIKFGGMELKRSGGVELKTSNTRYSQLPHPISKELILEKIDVAKLIAFKEIIPGVNSLFLDNIKGGCFRNIMPTIDQNGLDVLTSLSLRNCHNMECLLDTTDPDWNPTTAFSSLYSLNLRGMNSFREFICGLPPKGLFKELQKLYVHGCNKLCTIVPAKLSRRLPNLKEVIVEKCKELKELFELDLVRTDAKENELLFSNLGSMRLLGLPELTRIWKGPAIEVASLVKLRVLEVVGCPRLTSLFSPLQARSLVQLHMLIIEHCDELKHVFSADDCRLEIQAISQEATVLLPQLKLLQLEELPNFISFWHENDIPPFPLMPSLKQLHVVGCPRIGTQFIDELQVFEKKLQKLKVEGLICSRLCNTVVEQLMTGSRISLQTLNITNVEGLQPLIQGLVKVKELEILGCEGVEEILEVGGEGRVANPSGGEHNAPSLQSTISWKSLRLEKLADLTCIWRGPSQILIFHNLWSLCVSECHGLKKHLLTTSIARSLLQLSNLEVKDCKELEQVFADDETGDRDKKSAVTLPRLCHLGLNELPNLISFCPSSYHFIFPSFRGYLSVNGCPNNHTGFSRETNTEGRTTTVHAKGEAFCSTLNRGKCNSIHSRISLPLYEEETEAEASI